MFDEPDFINERQLEDAITTAAKELLSANGFRVVAVRGSGLDVGLFARRGEQYRTVFLEIKAFAHHHGRCGFGNQKGEGNQIRLLFDDLLQAPRDADALALFNSHIRWVLGNRSAPIGAPRFVLFTSEQAKTAAASGVRPGKQNNFRLSTFESNWITWRELIDRLGRFLVSG